MKATYDKGKQQHERVHAQVVVVVEGCVYMIVKGYNKNLKVPGKQYLNINSVYFYSCSTYMQFMNSSLLKDVQE